MDISKHIKELNKQLYPTGRAWGFVHGSEQVDTEITEFVDGLGNPFVDGFGNAFISISSSEASPSKRLVNAYLKSYERLYENAFSILNQILADNDNFDATDAANWERIFGLSNIGLTLDERKTNILRKQSYPNGVAERGHYLFIQDQLQAAGFDVYVTENRFTDGAGGWNVTDPDTLPGPYKILANYADETVDDEFLNETFNTFEFGQAEFGEMEFGIGPQLTDEQKLRYTFFITDATFPNNASVPLARKNEFRSLLLKLKPAHTIGYLFINYT